MRPFEREGADKLTGARIFSNDTRSVFEKPSRRFCCKSFGQQSLELNERHAGRKLRLPNRSRHSFVSCVFMIGHGTFRRFGMPDELEPELSHGYPVVLRCAGSGFPGKHEGARCIFAVLP